MRVGVGIVGNNSLGVVRTVLEVRPQVWWKRLEKIPIEVIQGFDSLK